jgi:hypothetical protein
MNGTCNISPFPPGTSMRVGLDLPQNILACSRPVKLVMCRLEMIDQLLCQHNEITLTHTE